MTSASPITIFDIYDLPEMPTFILCNPDKTELYALGTIINRVYSPRLNTFSELSFTAYETVNGTIMPYYDYLVNKRLVYVENLGYFMITGNKESGDGIQKHKEITCQSLEVEMNFKMISYLSGTYKFYDAIDPTDTLMEKILEYMPAWSIGTIDAAVAILYRTFDITSDTTVYNFLMTDVEEAYQCVFVFDTINRTISAYTTTNAVTETDIYISYDNVIQEIDIEESADELVTSLTVLGGGDLSINQVNPLGTNNIYNFTYFKTTDWMSQNLIDAITAWENLVIANQTDYADGLTALENANIDLLALQAELVALQTEYKSLDGVRSVDIKMGINLTSINAQLAAKQAEIDSKNIEIAGQQALIVTLTAELTAINTLLSFDSNFTSAQILELQPYIIQNSYTNENFIQTDNMTNAEIQAEAQALYDQAVSVLTKISEPRYTFDVNAVNFLRIKEFQEFIDQIVLGAEITLEVKDGVLSYPILLGFDLNYDDPTSFKLVFGNRLRLDDQEWQYSDLQSNMAKTSATTRVNSLQWSSWNNNYKSEVTTFIDSSLDATANAVISGSAQDVLIDQNGIRIRQNLGGSTYDDVQMWMNNGVLAFTDDNWSTAKLALGTITSGSSTFTGLVGDYIVGRIIAGNQLTIENDSNTFVVDGNGATLTDATMEINSTNGNTKIFLDPENGIKIQGNNSGTWEDKFYADSSGNLVFTGNLTGATGTFSGAINATSGTLGGWTIGANGISDTHGNYINSDGNVKLGELVISGTTAVFSGNIYANKINGTINADQIGNLSADKITSGTMSANRIYGGTLYWSGGYIALNSGYSELKTYGSLYINSGDVTFKGSVFAPSYSEFPGGIGAGASTFTSITTTSYLQANGGVSATIFVGPGYSNKALHFTRGTYTGYSAG